MFVEIKHVGDGREPVIEHADGRLESLRRWRQTLRRKVSSHPRSLCHRGRTAFSPSRRIADIFVHVVITAREMEAKEEARRRKELADTVGVPENVVKLLGY